MWGKNKSLLSHHFIVKSAVTIASCVHLFVYWKGKCPKNFFLWENTNVKGNRTFKEAPDHQLGLIFQLLLGLLKIHSSQSSPQQAVLTIPSQLKPLSVNASGGVQTILMPVNKGQSCPHPSPGLWLSPGLPWGASPRSVGRQPLLPGAASLTVARPLAPWTLSINSRTERKIQIIHWLLNSCPLLSWGDGAHFKPLWELWLIGALFS